MFNQVLLKLNEYFTTLNRMKLGLLKFFEQ